MAQDAGSATPVASIGEVDVDDIGLIELPSSLQTVTRSSQHIDQEACRLSPIRTHR